MIAPRGSIDVLLFPSLSKQYHITVVIVGGCLILVVIERAKYSLAPAMALSLIDLSKPTIKRDDITKQPNLP